MKYVILILWIYAFAKAEVSYSQSEEKQKIEHEFRINKNEVPKKAINFISKFRKETNVKWLQEEGADGTSIEAKFKYLRKRYSVEFTTDGILEDVEIIIPFSKIPQKIKFSIENYLKSNFDYFKTEKTQEQYQESEQRILKWLVTDIQFQTLKPKYEVVVKTRSTGKGSNRYELLFDEEGRFIKRSQITIRSDNILRF